MHAPSRPGADSRWSGIGFGALWCLEVAGLLWMGWRRWADVLVDFGRELYVPWLLREGAALYRDLAYFNGPLAPHVNALAFAVFGTGYTVLLWWNLALFLLLSGLLWRFFRQTTDRITACMALLAAPPLFGFAEYTFLGNYNWMSPYSHDLTHGVLLGTAMCVCWLQRGRGGVASSWWETLAGLCLGLTLLTKVDVGLAALLAAGCWLWTRGGNWPVSLGRLLLGALPPLALATALLSRHMPVEEALGHLTFAWRLALGGRLAGDPFYQWVLGLDDPLANAWGMVRETLATVGLLAFLLATGAWFQARGSMRRRLLPWMAGLLGLTLLGKQSFPWLMQGRSLPAATLGLGVWIWLAWRRERDAEARGRLAGLLCWAAFSLGLLAKMGLNPKFYHYGFGLALPAGCLLVAGLVWLAPRRWPELAGPAFRWLVVAVLCLDAAVVALWSFQNLGRRTMALGQGEDVFMVSPSAISISPPGEAMAALLEIVRRETAQGERLLVYPEGALLNYLVRRPSATPFNSFMPPETAMYGREAMLNAVKRARPEVVVVHPRSMVQYGFGFWGPLDGEEPYTPELLAWLEGEYGLRWRWEHPAAYPVSVYRLGAANATSPLPRARRFRATP